MSQNYGVLRVVRVRPPANATAEMQERYPGGWLPEEQLVHLLTRQETTIGRALNNDILLMDPTVSREHARLVLNEYGWHVQNLTVNNIVRVNGHPVPSGVSMAMKSQDVLVLGSTMLQLIAPRHVLPYREESEQATELLSLHPKTLSQQSTPSSYIMEPQVFEGLREIAYGRWEGRNEKEIAGSEPEDYGAWVGDPGLMSPPGGESAFAIAARALPLLVNLRKDHTEGHVVAVSHKATIRVLTCALLGMPLGRFRAQFARPPASVTPFEFGSRGAMLVQIGDTSYL